MIKETTVAIHWPNHRERCDMIKIGLVVFYVCLLPLIDDAMCEEGILIADDCVVAERQMARIVATMPSSREVFRGARLLT